jgi:L-threonate 2-dehydrogenase
MAPTVVVIAPGEMGSGVGRRLKERGCTVRTSLEGRSKTSAERAARAGMTPIEDDAALIEGADFVLSIIPPGEALALAERLAPALSQAKRKPAYADCNAVSPERVRAVAAVIAPTGAPFADIGIIGAPPKADDAGPRLYASGEGARPLLVLRDYGLDLRLIEAGIGEASALKMGYASLTKGLTAIGASMMEAAMASGIAPALQAELAASQPQLSAWLARQVPGMYAKAYRWVAEMEEIADFVGADPAAQAIYRGAARLYQRVAAENGKRGAPDNMIDRLDAFLKR